MLAVLAAGYRGAGRFGAAEWRPRGDSRLEFSGPPQCDGCARRLRSPVQEIAVGAWLRPRHISGSAEAVAKRPVLLSDVHAAAPLRPGDTSGRACACSRDRTVRRLPPPG